MPQLKAGEVHLWSASLVVTAADFVFYRGCLDEQEIARADRYRGAHGRERFIVARGLLKRLLANYGECDPRSVRFSRGPMGKPYLHPKPGLSLQFNATDTRSEAIFAFCRNAEIGVDLELLTRIVRHEPIAQRKFSAAENCVYRSLSAAQQKEYFLSLWTRKEAFGKAKGVGIRYRLNSVSLITGSDFSPTVVADDAGVIWEIRQVKPFATATASVVTQGTGWKYRCFRFAGGSQ